MGAGYIIYIDTGGTFSDAVIVKEDGSFINGKASTTPAELLRCFFACIEDAGQKMGLSLQELLSKTDIIGFGTTAGTNLLITRLGGPKIGLITTKGFEDTTIIMRSVGRWVGLPLEQGLHIAGSDKPEPLIPRDYIKGVTERVDSRGNIAVSLYETEVYEVVKALAAQGVEGIAVVMLWSFLNDTHEKRTQEIIQEIIPGMPVSISSEVAPIIREYQRFNSTIIDLYIGKPVRDLFSRVRRELKNYGYHKDLLVMQASGGLSHAAVVHPITTLHSGPVGGLIGVNFMKGLYGVKNAIGSDVGGTSFDISLSPEGGFYYTREPIIARFNLANPMIEIESIGAGGGTIAWVDEITGQLRLGPMSAGAIPGPACYNLGGTEPTVTDADLVLNRIDANFFLDGKIKLSSEKAYEAIEEKIAKPLTMSVEEAALAICTVIDQTMKSALNMYLGKKGLDPKKFVLFAFGGAGPTHCAGYGSGLGFQKIIIPPFAATFSAFGASMADILHRYYTSPYLVIPNIPFDLTREYFQISDLHFLDPGIISRFNDTFAKLEERAYQEMVEEGFSREEIRIKYRLDMRYGGQLYEVNCISPVNRIHLWEDFQAVLQSFEQEYIRLYGEGTKYPRGGVEVITQIVEVSAPPTCKPQLIAFQAGSEEPRRALKGERRVCFIQGWLPSLIYDITLLETGNKIEGPAIIEGNNTTVVIPPKFCVMVDSYRNMILEEPPIVNGGRKLSLRG